MSVRCSSEWGHLLKGPFFTNAIDTSRRPGCTSDAGERASDSMLSWASVGAAKASWSSWIGILSTPLEGWGLSRWIILIGGRGRALDRLPYRLFPETIRVRRQQWPHRLLVNRARQRLLRCSAKEPLSEIAAQSAPTVRTYLRRGLLPDGAAYAMSQAR